MCWENSRVSSRPSHVADSLYKIYKGMQLMTIYENNIEFRFFQGMVGGFATAMMIHAIENFEHDEKVKNELSEEDFRELYEYDWKGNNIRPEAIYACEHIIKEFLDNSISVEQKNSIEEMDAPDKINFGFALYLGLFRNPVALDEEYQQAIKEFPSKDLVPAVEIGDDGKAGIVFAKAA